MIRLFLSTVLIGNALFAAEAHLPFSSLPTAVRTAARAEAEVTGAKIVGASREQEKGRIVFEVQTKKDGKFRDLSFDFSGKLLASEQEVDINSVPALAKASLEKQAVGGTVQKVEILTMGDSVSYEAAIMTKVGKHTEIAVNADGSPHRD